MCSSAVKSYLWNPWSAGVWREDPDKHDGQRGKQHGPEYIHQVADYVRAGRRHGGYTEQRRPGKPLKQPLQTGV